MCSKREWVGQCQWKPIEINFCSSLQSFYYEPLTFRRKQFLVKIGLSYQWQLRRNKVIRFFQFCVFFRTQQIGNKRETIKWNSKYELITIKQEIDDWTTIYWLAARASYTTWSHGVNKATWLARAASGREKWRTEDASLLPYHFLI